MKRVVLFAIVLYLLAISLVSCATPLDAENTASFATDGKGEEMIDDRFYISDRYSPFDICKFSGASMTTQTLLDLCAKLDGAEWNSLADMLLARGITLDTDMLFDEGSEENKSVSNADRIGDSTLGTTDDGKYAFIEISGWLGSYIPAILLYYQSEDGSYLPYIALAAPQGIDPVEKHVRAGGYTWLVADQDGVTGTGYLSCRRSWFNLETRQTELSYSYLMHSGDSPTRNAYETREFNVIDECLLDQDEAWFSVEVTVAIQLKVDYYDDDWKDIDKTDEFTTEIPIRFSYDLERHEFYSVERAEGYFLRCFEPDLSKANLAILFCDELGAIAEDDFQYRADWAKSILN